MVTFSKDESITRGCHINAACGSVCIHNQILDDQEITDNCRRAQIHNDIHIITRKYTDVYRENARFDRRKLALIP